MVEETPLLIEFAGGTHIGRDQAVPRGLPIVRNGPPGTHIVFADGGRVNLPTDQIVLADEHQGRARVGFGGMSFEGFEGDDLVFFRVLDLQPEHLLSPERGRKMTLRPSMVERVLVRGRQVYPLLPKTRPPHCARQGRHFCSPGGAAAVRSDMGSAKVDTACPRSQCLTCASRVARGCPRPRSRGLWHPQWRPRGASGW